MYHWMSGWGGFWMTFMMVLWIALWGGVVYVAVKMANRPPSDPRGQH
jgi:hypothetical protein